MIVQSAVPDSGTYTVIRGVLGSTAAAHFQQPMYSIWTDSTIVAPFAQGFFENLASANYLHTGQFAGCAHLRR